MSGSSFPHRIVVRIKQESTLLYLGVGSRFWELQRLEESHPSSLDNSTALLVLRQAARVGMEYGMEGVRKA